MPRLTMTGLRSIWIFAGAAIASICVMIVLLSTRTQTPRVDHETPQEAKVSDQRVEAFCKACHVLPLPASFPKDAWHHEVLQGYAFYAQSGRKDLDPPPPHQAVNYFRSRAPDRLILPDPVDATKPLQVAFYIQTLTRPVGQEIPLAVASIRWEKVFAADQPQLLTVDMRRGEILEYSLGKTTASPRLIARLEHPCQIEVSDLDGDAHSEFIVADLGSFEPADHDQGRVVWLQQEGSVVKSHVLMSGVGRIADVRVIDANKDGHQDLIVAEFGWHKTGGIWLLTQVTPQTVPPHFAREKLSSLPGTIHLPTHDFDADGRMDFLALVSQEHERLELYLNRHPAGWEKTVIWAAPDPAFGSSGIQLADIDGDGDQDVLLSNGDSFDSMYIKPTHAIRWLENLGNLQFKEHLIGELPGAYCAKAGDIDGDGDLDILASVWLPRQSHHDVDRSKLAAITYFEQTASHVFERHTLERGTPYFAALEIADFDSDGDLDFAVGANLSNNQQLPYSAAIWWNGRLGVQKREQSTTGLGTK